MEQSDGEVAGIKTATIKVEGEYAYGFLRTETGVHRLVRKSPFDSSNGRHTSFTSLFVYPEVDDSIDIEVNPADLRIDTYRASGAGGQHINKTDSAVRLTHGPTGIVVQCQNDRSQHRNKAEAMEMLKAKLYELELRKRMSEQQKLEDSRPTWAGATRSVPTCWTSPHQGLRTNFETGNTKGVLDGDLDDFISFAETGRLMTSTPSAFIFDGWHHRRQHGFHMQSWLSFHAAPGPESRCGCLLPRVAGRTHGHEIWPPIWATSDASATRWIRKRIALPRTVRPHLAPAAGLEAFMASARRAGVRIWPQPRRPKTSTSRSTGWTCAPNSTPSPAPPTWRAASRIRTCSCWRPSGPAPARTQHRVRRRAAGRGSGTPRRHARRGADHHPAGEAFGFDNVSSPWCAISASSMSNRCLPAPPFNSHYLNRRNDHDYGSSNNSA
jgi:protein subunit release factor B